MVRFLSRSTSLPGGESATKRGGGTNRLTGYEPARTKEANWNATSRKLGTISHRTPRCAREGTSYRSYKSACGAPPKSRAEPWTNP